MRMKFRKVCAIINKNKISDEPEHKENKELLENIRNSLQLKIGDLCFKVVAISNNFLAKEKIVRKILIIRNLELKFILLKTWQITLDIYMK
jgi:hypothetical protein